MVTWGTKMLPMELPKLAFPSPKSTWSRSTWLESTWLESTCSRSTCQEVPESETFPPESITHSCCLDGVCGTKNSGSAVPGKVLRENCSIFYVINCPITKHMNTYTRNKMPKWHWSRKSIHLLSTPYWIGSLMNFCKAATGAIFKSTQLREINRWWVLKWLSFLPFNSKRDPLFILLELWPTLEQVTGIFIQ